MNNNNLIKKLENGIEDLLDKLSTKEAGTEEYMAIVNNIDKLYGTLNKEKEIELSIRKLDVEETKNGNEHAVKKEQLQLEAVKNLDAVTNNNQQREFQSIENSKDRDIQITTIKDSRVWNSVKTGVEVAGLVAPLVFYGVWMSRGLEFEKEGSFTSNTFKGLIGKFKPTK